MAKVAEAKIKKGKWVVEYRDETAEEAAQRAQDKQDFDDRQAAAAEREADRQSAIAKLKALGLSDEEVEALYG